MIKKIIEISKQEADKILDPIKTNTNNYNTTHAS